MRHWRWLVVAMTMGCGSGGDRYLSELDTCRPDYDALIGNQKTDGEEFEELKGSGGGRARLAQAVNLDQTLDLWGVDVRLRAPTRPASGVTLRLVEANPQDGLPTGSEITSSQVGRSSLSTGPSWVRFRLQEVTTIEEGRDFFITLAGDYAETDRGAAEWSHQTSGTAMWEFNVTTEGGYWRVKSNHDATYRLIRCKP